RRATRVLSFDPGLERIRYAALVNPGRSGRSPPGRRVRPDAGGTGASDARFDWDGGASRNGIVSSRGRRGSRVRRCPVREPVASQWFARACAKRLERWNAGGDGVRNCSSDSALCSIGEGSDGDEYPVAAAPTNGPVE